MWFTSLKPLASGARLVIAAMWLGGTETERPLLVIGKNDIAMTIRQHNKQLYRRAAFSGWREHMKFQTRKCTVLYISVCVCVRVCLYVCKEKKDTESVSVTRSLFIFDIWLCFILNEIISTHAYRCVESDYVCIRWVHFSFSFTSFLHLSAFVIVLFWTSLSYAPDQSKLQFPAVLSS